MKLIECYVNNFGRLSDRHFSFTPGLNVLAWDNGEGKSTLMAFIKSMLFGLEDTKKPKLDDNDRKKYEPWQGGAWGGSLTVYANGKTYRIERSFDKKASLDQRKIYDLSTGKESDEFSDTEPGIRFFGIDREGFERTVFLSERSFAEKYENDSVFAKLSNLTGVSFDIDAFDAATKLLEEERKFYYKQGGSGAISELTRKCTELEFKRAELLSLEKKHLSDKKAIDEYELSLAELKAKNELLLEEEKKKAAILGIFTEYKKKLSSRDDTLTKLSEIKDVFGDSIPKKEELYELSRTRARIESLTLLKEENAAKLKAIKPYPDESELDFALIISAKIEDTDKKTKELEEKKLDTGADKTKKNSILMIASLFLIALGIGLAFLKPYFIALSVVGALALAVKLLPGRTKKLADALELEKAELKEKRENLNAKLSDFLRGYGVQDLSYTEAITELRARRSDAEMNASLLKTNEETISTLKEQELALCERYPAMAKVSFEKLTEALELYNRLLTSYETLDKECTEMKDEYGFNGADISLNNADGIDTKEAIFEGERKLSLMKNSFALDELALEELEEVSAELERMRKDEADYKYKLSVIKKTKAYLEEARDSLNAKYLGKTRASLEEYMNTVAALSGEVNIDTAFTVTKTELGKTRVRDSFSKGTRELFGFALRLALTDSLYESEEPFIMLDDPFAYFDDQRLSKATALLKKLSEKKQIIYLTASSARAPK